MIRFSFEVPIKHLEDFYSLQDFLFCISSIAMDSFDYFNFHKEKSNEKYLILDNSSFELGEPLPIPSLVSLAYDLGADEIVAPDISNNPEKTIIRSVELFKYLEEKELLNMFNVMVVPQGKTVDEILNCLVKLLRLPARVIGIPARILPANTPYRSEQLRFFILQKLAQKKILNKKHSIHLLGLCGIQFMKAYAKGQRYFKIRSLDTSFPVVLGMLGKTFLQTKRKPLTLLPYEAVLFKKTIERIKFNIRFLKSYR